MRASSPLHAPRTPCLRWATALARRPHARLPSRRIAAVLPCPRAAGALPHLARRGGTGVRAGGTGDPPAAPAHHPPVAGPPKKQQQGRPRRSQRKPRVPPPLPFARANRRLQQARYSQGRPPPLGKEKRGQSVVGGKRAGARAAAAGGREPTVGQRVRRRSAT